GRETPQYTDRKLDALVLLEAPQIEQRLASRAVHGGRLVEGVIDAAAHHVNLLRPDLTALQVLARAVGKHLKLALSIDVRNGPLLRVDVGGERKGSLLEDGGAEEMRDVDQHRAAQDERRVEGELVQILHYHVDPLFQMLA